MGLQGVLNGITRWVLNGIMTAEDWRASSSGVRALISDSGSAQQRFCCLVQELLSDFTYLLDGLELYVSVSASSLHAEAVDSWCTIYLS